MYPVPLNFTLKVCVLAVIIMSGQTMSSSISIQQEDLPDTDITISELLLPTSPDSQMSSEETKKAILLSRQTRAHSDDLETQLVPGSYVRLEGGGLVPVAQEDNLHLDINVTDQLNQIARSGNYWPTTSSTVRATAMRIHYYIPICTCRE